MEQIFTVCSVEFAGWRPAHIVRSQLVTRRRTTSSPAAEVYPGRVLGAVADPTRLRVLAAVVLAPGPVDAAQLSDAAGLPLKRVEHALQSLEAAGVNSRSRQLGTG